MYFFYRIMQCIELHRVKKNLFTNEAKTLSISKRLSVFVYSNIVAFHIK